MKLKLKPVSEQVIVITGASSGIGLSTARMAVKRGARVVLAARSHESLHKLQEELNAGGEKAAHVAADVSKPEDVHKIAQTAIDKFGGFDTWVNDAGTSVYGRITQVPTEDEQAVMAVNFWGTLYGSKEAVAHLREKGGALINVGSEASDHALPLQGIYTASKHAIKAYTDALRMELEKDGVPISVTLIKPTGIATPFFEHSKNYMEQEPAPPPPVFAPELVAEAILYAAENQTRDFFVGESAVMNSLLGRFTPLLNDKVMKAMGFVAQQSPRTPKPGDHQALEHASGELKERGDYEVTVVEASAYSKAKMNPALTVALAGVAGVAALAAWRRR